MKIEDSRSTPHRLSTIARDENIITESEKYKELKSEFEALRDSEQGDNVIFILKCDEARTFP